MCTPWETALRVPGALRPPGGSLRTLSRRFLLRRAVFDPLFPVDKADSAAGRDVVHRMSARPLLVDDPYCRNVAMFRPPRGTMGTCSPYPFLIPMDSVALCPSPRFLRTVPLSQLVPLPNPPSRECPLDQQTRISPLRVGSLINLPLDPLWLPLTSVSLPFSFVPAKSCPDPSPSDLCAEYVADHARRVSI